MKKIIYVLILIFWPLNLLFANTLINWLHYLLPSFFIGVSFILFTYKPKYFLLPLFFVPIVEPKLILFPLLVSIAFLTLKKNKQLSVISLIISFMILVFLWRPFWGQTIFQKDYEAQQLVIRNGQLYHSVFLARLFQNKPKIIFDKFTGNIFALTDPGNYFFGFQPRQIKVNNQNLDKFPFIGVVFFFVGLYFLKNNTNKFFIILIVFSCLISLSILNNFDRNDFILWLPLSLIAIFGVNKFKNKYFYFIFLLFSFAQIIRLLIIK